MTKKVCIYTIKEKLNIILQENKICLWIMIDKLDEFVLRKEFDIQKKLLRGLIITESLYSNLSNIFLKIFIRSDLFYRLDFSSVSIGYDKILSRKVDFKWRPQEIRRFIAQRIAFNLMKVLNLKYLSITVKGHEIKLTKSDISDLTTDKLIQPLNSINRKLFKNKDSRDGIKISITDELSKMIITKIFPRKVDHYDENGKNQRIDIFQFFDTHFNLIDKNPTPRSILRFLDLCMEKTKDYFRENYETIELDKNEEYPLVKRICFREAYGSLIEEICQDIINSSKDLKHYVKKILQLKGRKRRFTFLQFKDMLKIDNETLEEILNYLRHMGCLKCIYNDPKNPEKRKYEFSIFLQATPFYSLFL